MAVTIIKEGRLKIPVFRATCPCCDCVFEFNKEDATLNEDRDGKYFQLNCPHCGHPVWSWKTNPIRYDDVKKL